jgi:putative addiction module component (TIGR02574 family)
MISVRVTVVHYSMFSFPPYGGSRGTRAPKSAIGNKPRRDTITGAKTMSVIPKELQDQVMRLPVRLRARLAEQLIASLEQEPVDAEAETLWTTEALRRADELSTGKVKGIPAERAFAKARSAIR